MPRRRALTVALSWVLVLGVARVGVALPESCPDVTAGEARTAAGEAVEWFLRNQRDDGRWVYGYDREADQVDARPHVVRHSGVILSLYQANAAGIDDALEVADRGVEWSLGEAVTHDGWRAVPGGDEIRTGGTALLLAGLVERHNATGETHLDDEMAALGRFLVAMTEPSGAVLASWDLRHGRPEPGEYSAYFTGETFMALALLAEVDPEGPWERTAQRIGRYLVTERDDAEGRFPPTSDHWAAYGLAQLDRIADDPLDAGGRAYARRLAELFGIQVRYESQRTGRSLNAAVLRGPRTTGSGLGTIGEGLGSLWLLPPSAMSAGDHRVVAERVRCVAGMLVDRQADAGEADDVARPGLARGAWFANGATRMDDQQHALSALLLAHPVLSEPGSSGGSSSDDGLGRAMWLALVALAAGAPGRVRRALPGATARTLLPGVAVATAGLAGVALVAGPLLQAISVSPATALVAAGVAVAVGALVDLVHRPPPSPSPSPAPPGTESAARAAPPWATVMALTLRPVPALLVLAVAGDIGRVAGVATALAAGAAALVALPGDRPFRGAALGATAVIAALGAVDLIVDGVLSV